MNKTHSILAANLPSVLQNSDSNSDKTSSQQGQLAELDPKLGHPKMYRVLLLNDDYTPMDFVVLVLKRFFAKTEEQANKIMLDVHKKGAGTAGIFTLEVAEMKVMQTNQFARSNQHPLKCTLETES